MISQWSFSYLHGCDSLLKVLIWSKTLAHQSLREVKSHQTLKNCPRSAQRSHWSFKDLSMIFQCTPTLSIVEARMAEWFVRDHWASDERPTEFIDRLWQRLLTDYWEISFHLRDCWVSIEGFKRFHGNGKSRIGAINTGAINSQFINLSLDFLKFSTRRSDKDGPPRFLVSFCTSVSSSGQEQWPSDSVKMLGDLVEWHHIL